MASSKSIIGKMRMTEAGCAFIDNLHDQAGEEVMVIALLIAHDAGRQTATFGDVLHAFSSWNNGITRLSAWKHLLEYANADQEDFGGISVG